MLVLFVVLSIGLAAKVVPFVPKELIRADVDIAKVELKKLKMVETEALKMAEKEKQFVKTLVEATTEEPLIPGEYDDDVEIDNKFQFFQMTTIMLFPSLLAPFLLVLFLWFSCLTSL